MPKPVKATVKLHLPGGQATPAPPVGPALSPQGIRIGEFIKDFNDRTRDQMGVILPVVVTIYQDSTYSLMIKSPLASVLLKEAAGLAKGSGEAGKESVGRVTKDDLRRIAERKMEDLNTDDVEAACRVIAGSARSMGIEVVDEAELVEEAEAAGEGEAAAEAAGEGEAAAEAAGEGEAVGAGEAVKEAEAAEEAVKEAEAVEDAAGETEVGAAREDGDGGGSEAEGG